MKITDSAKQLLENFLKEKGKEGIRIFSIEGSCGSQFSMNLVHRRKQIRLRPLTEFKWHLIHK